MMTIEVKGLTYRIGQMDAVSQFHVTRRIGPLLATMGLSLSQLSTGMNLDMDDFAPILGPVTEMMAKMSDEDANYVIFTCLSVVARDQGGSKFAPITSSGHLMFEDIDMPGMLRLVIEVLKSNLGAFLQGLGAEVTSPSS